MAEHVTCSAISRDGRRIWLATTPERALAEWRWGRETPGTSRFPAEVHAVAFKPDGSLAAVGFPVDRNGDSSIFEKGQLSGPSRGTPDRYVCRIQSDGAMCCRGS